MRPGGQRQPGCALPPGASHVGAGARERGARHSAAGGRRRRAPLLGLLSGLRLLLLHLGLLLLLLPLLLRRMGRVRRLAARVIRGRGPRGRAVRGRGPRGGGGLQRTRDAARGLRGPCATAPTALLSGPCSRGAGERRASPGGRGARGEEQRPAPTGQQPAASSRRCRGPEPPPPQLSPTTFYFREPLPTARADPLERRTTRSTPLTLLRYFIFLVVALSAFDIFRSDFFDFGRSIGWRRFVLKWAPMRC